MHGIIAKGNPLYGQENELHYICNEMGCVDPEFDEGQLEGVDCCFQRKIAHHQALVYLYNSKIRYSFVGISAGDNSFLSNVGSYPFAPQGTSGIHRLILMYQWYPLISPIQRTLQEPLASY